MPQVLKTNSDNAKTCNEKNSEVPLVSSPTFSTQQPPVLEGSEAKKMATGGVNKFDLDMGKNAHAKMEMENSDSVRGKDRRAARNRKQTDQPEDLLSPGPGILARAQLAKRTRFGLLVQPNKLTRLTTMLEQVTIRSNPRTSKNLKIILDEPFNLVSAVTELIGLTGAGGIVKERFEQFSHPVGCLINVTYEVPLLKVDNIESFRIPVEDDRKEDLSVYFEEVTDMMHSFHVKGQATIVHCMAGVSRSACLVLAYLIRFDKMSLEQAFRCTKKARSVINPNLSFLEQLAQFEATCHPAHLCTAWHDHTENGITKRLPQFIIADFLEDYQIEFDNE